MPEEKAFSSDMMMLGEVWKEAMDDEDKIRPDLISGAQKHRWREVLHRTYITYLAPCLVHSN